MLVSLANREDFLFIARIFAAITHIADVHDDQKLGL